MVVVSDLVCGIRLRVVNHRVASLYPVFPPTPFSSSLHLPRQMGAPVMAHHTTLIYPAPLSWPDLTFFVSILTLHLTSCLTTSGYDQLWLMKMSHLIKEKAFWKTFTPEKAVNILSLLVWRNNCCLEFPRPWKLWLLLDCFISCCPDQGFTS